MSGLLMLGIAAAILYIAYHTYGTYLCKIWGVDPNRKTPAVEMADGVDYVPAPKAVLFGHQFASIAGAGPINGPIMAAMFGWGPVLAWILVGGIFFGAVQDFASLYASVRNQGKSMGFIIEKHIGKVGKTLFLIFMWLFCLLILAAFADIVAATFNGLNADQSVNIPNASTASTSLFFIGAAVLYAFLSKAMRINGVASAAVAIGLLVLCITFGLNFPIVFEKQIWTYFVFAYIFLAAIAPVWVLLQPRDYLNSYLLLFMIGAACIGIVIANPNIGLPMFTGFVINGQFLFPILFVTVACGAVSGFHSLVSAGTTSKQISNEADMKLIGFGSMLIESLLAVIALICVGALYANNTMPQGAPPVIFANAVSQFLGALGMPSSVSFTLITLAISAFALTSLDSVARIGRLALQELFTPSTGEVTTLSTVMGNKYIATGITLFMGYLLSIGGYQNIWPLFGSANQLLAALSLIALAVYLKKKGLNGKMLHFPMLFMLCVTVCALCLTMYNLAVKIFTGVSYVPLRDNLQMVFTILLIGLACVVALQSLRALQGKPATSEEATA